MESEGLPSVHDPEVAATQPHAMTNDAGDFFYPDGPQDARHFAEHHGARYVDKSFSGFDEPTHKGGSDLHDLHDDGTGRPCDHPDYIGGPVAVDFETGEVTELPEEA